ncbi:MAG: hypothetical protein PVF59_05985 [Desulfobacterales bacterium]|jgi:hypothetical protein
MLKVIATQNYIEIQSRLPAGQRALLAAVAVFPLLAPYQLIIRPDWQGYLNVYFLFVAAISIGAVAVSGLFAWAAVAGLNERLRFDRAQGYLTYAVGAPIVRQQTTRRPLADIAHLETVIHDWSDGAPSYSFVTHMVDGKTFKAGSSWSRKEIDRIVARVSTFLGWSSYASQPLSTGGLE